MELHKLFEVNATPFLTEKLTCLDFEVVEGKGVGHNKKMRSYVWAQLAHVDNVPHCHFEVNMPIDAFESFLQAKYSEWQDGFNEVKIEVRGYGENAEEVENILKVDIFDLYRDGQIKMDDVLEFCQQELPTYEIQKEEDFGALHIDVKRAYLEMRKELFKYDQKAWLLKFMMYVEGKVTTPDLDWSTGTEDAAHLFKNNKLQKVAA